MKQIMVSLDCIGVTSGSSYSLTEIILHNFLFINELFLSARLNDTLKVDWLERIMFPAIILLKSELLLKYDIAICVLIKCA